jgi:hypothetical protein
MTSAYGGGARGRGTRGRAGVVTGARVEASGERSASRCGPASGARACAGRCATSCDTATAAACLARRGRQRQVAAAARPRGWAVDGGYRAAAVAGSHQHPHSAPAPPTAHLQPLGKDLPGHRRQRSAGARTAASCSSLLRLPHFAVYAALQSQRPSPAITQWMSYTMSRRKSATRPVEYFAGVSTGPLPARRRRHKLEV